MAAIIMDGRALSAHLMPEPRANIDLLKSKFGCTPSLDALSSVPSPSPARMFSNFGRRLDRLIPSAPFASRLDLDASRIRSWI
jgi:hypothetical protein